MIKDVNMQHMTMREYVAIAMLTELGSKDAVLKLISEGDITSVNVIETSFAWADNFMKVREDVRRFTAKFLGLAGRLMQ
jgi:hypothetical protein